MGERSAGLGFVSGVLAGGLEEGFVEVHEFNDGEFGTVSSSELTQAEYAGISAGSVQDAWSNLTEQDFDGFFVLEVSEDLSSVVCGIFFGACD